MTLRGFFKLLRALAIGLLLTIYGGKMFIDDYAINKKIKNDLEQVDGKIIEIKEIKLSQPSNSMELAPTRVEIKLDNNNWYKSDRYNDIILADNGRGLFAKDKEVVILAFKNKLPNHISIFADLQVNDNKLLDIEEYYSEYKTMGGIKYFFLCMGLFLLGLGVFAVYFWKKEK